MLVTYPNTRPIMLRATDDEPMSTSICKVNSLFKATGSNYNNIKYSKENRQKTENKIDIIIPHKCTLQLFDIENCHQA
jgi:hypothetical protein